MADECELGVAGDRRGFIGECDDRRMMQTLSSQAENNVANRPHRISPGAVNPIGRLQHGVRYGQIPGGRGITATQWT